ncbi:hypothetical protein [Pseudodesulfovibrio piezophilus]|uniref:Uncharacterized protein n=1 Tax=Pseudodesulfovibrio piezophilus (strain DSM 21447 / JCM 15486 / C1TLV30) TaxID=1322246 RepID=M1WLD4_PSEP2|nr:hypothetical protein [Pseudodesulfovibrio piezophilus]CCH47670.1 conserved protein of unknown function [Pseudodesulfovibrio piezophilus C1TLV30]
MATIITQNELTRKAVAWISEQIQVNDILYSHYLLEKAAVRFNLSPKDVDFLQRFYREEQGLV